MPRFGKREDWPVTRRSKSKPPRPGMKWSRKHGAWIDPDTRSPERKAKDEEILRQADAERDRIQDLLRRARETKEPPAVEEAAALFAESVLRSSIEARKKADLSQAEVARRMGVPQPAIVRLEAGARSPTLATLTRYASAIGIDLQVGLPAG